MTKPKPPADAIAILTAEIADYEKQFNEAQQQANIWQHKVTGASCALQACKAVLARSQSPTQEETAPAS